MKATLANPRGFCAGVDRAIDIVERALELYGAPIYVRHEVVHNRYVVNDLKNKGAVFVDELDAVPDDSTVIFSAHGVSEAVETEANRRGLEVFNATCPLVTKVHMEVNRYSEEGREAILIGHAGHPEVEGTMGRYDRAHGGDIYLVETLEDVEHLQVRHPESLTYVTQTTLSMDDTKKIIEALQQHFPNIHGPKRDDICYATQNRQDAVKQLTKECDLLLVVGSTNSSNSNRLREIAENRGIESYLIDSAEEINPDWLSGKDNIGVTAGASAPESIVQSVLKMLRENGVDEVLQNTITEETVSFNLPQALR